MTSRLKQARNGLGNLQISGQNGHYRLSAKCFLPTSHGPASACPDPCFDPPWPNRQSHGKDNLTTCFNYYLKQSWQLIAPDHRLQFGLNAAEQRPLGNAACGIEPNRARALLKYPVKRSSPELPLLRAGVCLCEWLLAEREDVVRVASSHTGSRARMVAALARSYLSLASVSLAIWLASLAA
jgi:hypothetical protein